MEGNKRKENIRLCVNIDGDKEPMIRCVIYQQGDVGASLLLFFYEEKLGEIHTFFHLSLPLITGLGAWA